MAASEVVVASSNFNGYSSKKLWRSISTSKYFEYCECGDDKCEEMMFRLPRTIKEP